MDWDSLRDDVDAARDSGNCPVAVDVLLDRYDDFPEERLQGFVDDGHVSCDALERIADYCQDDDGGTDLDRVSAHEQRMASGL